MSFFKCVVLSKFRVYSEEKVHQLSLHNSHAAPSGGRPVDFTKKEMFPDVNVFSMPSSQYRTDSLLIRPTVH